jgi:hypothetical protein
MANRKAKPRYSTRKPQDNVVDLGSAAPSEALEAFISSGHAGRPDVFMNTQSNVQTFSGRGLVQRRNGRVRRRRTVYLPPDLDRNLSTFCAANGREVSETISEALALYLDRR